MASAETPIRLAVTPGADETPIRLVLTAAPALDVLRGVELPVTVTLTNA
jgi:hypothetical protein